MKYWLDGTAFDIKLENFKCGIISSKQIQINWVL